MTELQKTQRISIAVLLIGSLLLIGLMVKKAPKTPFTITAQEMQQTMNGYEHVFDMDVEEMQADTEKYLFVDLRSPYDYEVSHIENAINIPTAFLLDEENQVVFKETLEAKKTVVLYGQTERESISPWMLLYQIGFTNTKLLYGGYECYVEDKADCPTTYSRYDYAKISTQGGVKEVEIIKEIPKAPVKKKKPIPVKKKVKVEEEGGC